MPKLLKVVVGIFVLAAIWVAYSYSIVYFEGQRTTTIVRMRDLMSILLAEQPRNVAPGTLQPLLQKYGREECLKDAWDNPFQVQARETPDGVVYRIRSLGRDGEAGSCCQPFVSSADADVILENEAWLQRWTPRRMR